MLLQGLVVLVEDLYFAEALFQAGLCGALALEDSLFVLFRFLGALVGRNQVLLEASMRSSRFRRARSFADLVAAVQDLTVFFIKAGSEIEDGLFLAVDDLAQVQQIALTYRGATFCGGGILGFLQGRFQP